MSKIIVGMSGGVDSAVAAYLLRAAGHDVVGVTLRTWLGSNRCCEIDDARRVCDILGIPYYAVNCAGEFRDKIVAPFVEQYINGMTPNPCIGCNPDIKWAQLMDSMSLVGAQYIATGHYASVEKLPNGRYTVKNALYSEKDQTYMLYRLSQEQLACTIMPLGRLSKSEVRSIARSAGLPVAEKEDSQEICFVPDGDYASFICAESSAPLPPAGNFVDEEGNVLGRHEGIINYTVGQRKGLGIALGHPAYVKSIDPVTNEVVLSDNDALFTDHISVSDLTFMGMERPADGEGFHAKVRIRYRSRGESASVTVKGDAAEVVFETPVRAAAPGQSAVFYDEDGCVLGGGIINRMQA